MERHSVFPAEQRCILLAGYRLVLNLNYKINLNTDCFLFMKPQFRNPTNSLRSLRSKPPRMRFLLFKLTFCHILTDMSA